MPLRSGPSKKAVSENIGRLIGEGYPRAQAIAIAYRTAGRARKATLDLGTADVHAPAAMGPAKRAPKMKNAPRATKLTPAQAAKAKAQAKADKAKARTKGAGSKRGLFVRADLAPGGRLSVRHTLSDAEMSVHLRSVPFVSSGEIDPAAVGVTLKGPATYSDGTPVRLVWVNLAVPGRFRGHRAGEFELNDAVFAQVKTNFDRDGLPVHFDFEHASESDPTEGTIPERGAPAQGWVHRIEVRAGGLWGLTEWLDYARTGIKAGSFGFISPAIRFNSRDRVTGENIGARLTSAALTNSPFLTRLAPPIAASDRGATAEWEEAEEVALPALVELKAFAHSPAEYMGRLKAALKLNELSTPTEMSDQLARLRDHLDLADGDHTANVNGVALADYLHPLRDAVGAQPGVTWDQVFDLVQDLIDAAMDMHIIIDHGIEHTEDDDLNPLDMSGHAAEETTTMDPKMIADLTSKNAELTVSLKDTSTKLTDASTKLSDAESKLADVTMALKDESSKREAAEKELVTLRETVTARAQKDHDERVARAFGEYKDARKLTEDDKEMMSLLLKSNPEKFEARFPKIEPGQAHLQRNLTDHRTGEQPSNHIDEGSNPANVDPRVLARSLAAQRGIPLAQAQRAVLSLKRS
jgi:phage I-like protein